MRRLLNYFQPIIFFRMFNWTQKVSFKQIFDKYFIINVLNWNEKNEKECKQNHKEVLSTIKKKFPNNSFLLLNFSKTQYGVLDFKGIVRFYFIQKKGY
jgi:hypothetical protein